MSKSKVRIEENVKKRRGLTRILPKKDFEPYSDAKNSP